MIFLVPQGGIGNRLRSIKSGIKLSHDTKQPLKIIWVNKNECPCDITDLIEGIQGMEGQIEIKSFFCRRIITSRGRIDLKTLYHSVCYRIFFEVYKRRGIFFGDQGIRQGILESIKQIKGGKDVYLSSCYDFYGDTSYDEFIFKKELIKKAEEIFSDHRRNYIGIHIRQGDNIESIRCSPVKLFEEKIEELLTDDPQIMFFISTDDKNVLQHFLNKYRDKCVYYYDKVWDRWTREGQVTAFIEMLCLSMTRKIYGSYYSSFSDIAANIGKIEKEVVKK